MRFLLALLLFSSLEIKAQSDLKFEKRILYCEDEWIVLPMDTDSSYVYGFVYLDASAGLTFNLEGQFKIRNNQYIFNKSKSTKYRIKPNTTLVAIIPKKIMDDLQLPEKPDWLSFYKKCDPDERMYRLGLTYNEWGEHQIALKYLKGLKWSNYDEYFFNDPFVRRTDENKKGKFYIFPVDNFGGQYKEDILYYCNLNLLNLAESAYKTALVVCINEEAKAEMAYSIAFKYFKLKKAEQFNYWIKEIDRWILPNQSLKSKIEIMQKEIAK